MTEQKQKSMNMVAFCSEQPKIPPVKKCLIVYERVICQGWAEDPFLFHINIPYKILIIMFLYFCFKVTAHYISVSKVSVFCQVT